MRGTNFLIKLAATIFAVIALVTIVLVVLVAIEFHLPLDRLRPPLEIALSEVTEREVDINGELSLTLSNPPALSVRGLDIYNEPGWRSDTMVSLREVRFELALLPLLKGEFVLRELTANGASFNLEQDFEGRINWTGSENHVEQSVAMTSPETDQALESHRYFKDGIVFDRIRLNNIHFSYQGATDSLRLNDHLDTLEIDMRDRARLETTIAGAINDIPYRFRASSDLLRNLVNNKSWSLNLDGEIDGNSLSVESDLQLNNGKLRGQLLFQTNDLEAGRLLGQLGIVSGFDFHVRQVQLQANLEGSNFQDIIESSSFTVRLNEGVLKLKSHVDQRFQNISFDSAFVSTSRGQDLKLQFDGHVGNDPIQFSLLTNPPADFVAGLNEINLAIAANYLQAQIDLQGSARLPVSSKTLDMKLAISGASLDRWNRILDNDLPPIGPYQLSGQLSLSPEGYQIKDFSSALGDSKLHGSIEIDMTSERPVWTMDLVSNQLQLGDFDLEGYTLIPGKDSRVSIEKEEADSAVSAKEKERELSLELDKRLGETREIDRWDIDLRVDSQNIFSGDDRLGGGRIVVSARGDSIELNTELNIPGGQIVGDFDLKLVDEGIDGHVKLDMDRFDYGILLRHMDPDSTTNGLISAHVNLQLAGENFSRRFDRANGDFDFAVWPENTGAGDIDIWAANVFQAVSSSVTKSDSRLNCAVGVLNIVDGQLNQEFLGIDTTKVWLDGDLDINFVLETIELNLVPHAKKAKIGGIETPVYLKGALTEKYDTSDLKIAGEDITNTFISIIFSPLHAPVRRIFGRKIPEDNSKMCEELFDREKLESILATKKVQDHSFEDMFPGN